MRFLVVDCCVIRSEDKSDGIVTKAEAKVTEYVPVVRNRHKDNRVRMMMRRRRDASTARLVETLERNSQWYLNGRTIFRFE